MREKQVRAFRYARGGGEESAALLAEVMYGKASGRSVTNVESEGNYSAELAGCVSH